MTKKYSLDFYILCIFCGFSTHCYYRAILILQITSFVFCAFLFIIMCKQADKTEDVGWMILPPEILMLIFSYLKPTELFNCVLVCTFWRDLLINFDKPKKEIPGEEIPREEITGEEMVR